MPYMQTREDIEARIASLRRRLEAERHPKTVERLTEQIQELEEAAKNAPSPPSGVLDIPTVAALFERRRELVRLEAKPIDTWTGFDMSIAHLCVVAMRQILDGAPNRGRGW